MPRTKKAPTGLNQAALAALFRPGGRWARERGAAVRERRQELGLSPQELADLCVTRKPTIYRVESGDIVPSDRLRAIIAYHLDTVPENLWRSPSRLELEIVSRVGDPT